MTQVVKNDRCRRSLAKQTLRSTKCNNLAWKLDSSCYKKSGGRVATVANFEVFVDFGCMSGVDKVARHIVRPMVDARFSSQSIVVFDSNDHRPTYYYSSFRRGGPPPRNLDKKPCPLLKLGFCFVSFILVAS